MDSNKPRITIGFTYYNEPELLLQQIKYWKDYPVEVEVVLVDDGSQSFPAFEILKDHPLDNFRLYQVDEDLGFNSHGCRNLIAKIANSDFILLSDIDNFFAPEQIAKLKIKKFNPKLLYRFSYYTTHDKKLHLAPGHQNIFLVAKDVYWEAGGYDESYTGYHHGDREFLDALEKITNDRYLKDVVCRGVRDKRKVIFRRGYWGLPEYDNENMILYLSEKECSYSEMKDTVKTKINFSYTQLL